MKNRSLYLNKMKRYYSEVALIALICAPSIVQAMDSVDDEMKIPFHQLAVKLDKKGDPWATEAYHLAFEDQGGAGGQNTQQSYNRSNGVPLSNAPVSTPEKTQNISSVGNDAQANDTITTAKQLRKTFKKSPSSVSEKFKQFLQECKVQKNTKDFIAVRDDSIFILSGSIVGVSDINKKIANNPKCSIFCVYSDYFLFDENIEKPGATLFLNAPR